MNEHYIKGLEHCKNEQFEEAISAFNKSLLLNPNHTEAYYNRGMAKFRQEKYLASIQDFDEALRISPNDANIYSQRGVAKHLMGNSELAMKDMDKSQQLEPENPYRYTSRAFVRSKMGDLFGALDDYKIALELDPDDAVAWNNYGLLEEGMGYTKSAKERYEKADGIADKDREFNKPDLDQIIADVRSGKIQGEKLDLNVPTDKIKKKEAVREIKETKELKPSTNEYLKVMKEVFTSKETFSEFLGFVKGKFKK
jgi:tetratricopeptide (TPR) repeat protein